LKSSNSATKTAEADRPDLLKSARRLLDNKVLVAYALVVLSFAVGEVISRGFASFGHIMTVLQTAFFLGLVALGETIVIISGKEGIDLSVGPVFTFGVIVSAAVVDGRDSRILLALGAALAVGFLLGIVNGIGVSYLGIAPLIMTLGWGMAVEGIAYFSTGGFLPGAASPLLEIIGGKSLTISVTGFSLMIPWAVMIWLAIIALVAFLLMRTRIGFTLYATGANERTARLVGVRTKIVIMLAYAISGMFASLGGMFMLGYVGYPNLGLGNRYILPSVVAAIIGGVSITGGAGSYIGAVGGAVFLTSLLSILTTLGFGESSRQMIVGLVLLVMLANYARRSRQI
jgi:ribose transport system permease protein